MPSEQSSTSPALPPGPQPMTITCEVTARDMFTIYSWSLRGKQRNVWVKAKNEHIYIYICICSMLVSWQFEDGFKGGNALANVVMTGGTRSRAAQPKHETMQTRWLSQRPSPKCARACICVCVCVRVSTRVRVCERTRACTPESSMKSECIVV